MYHLFQLFLWRSFNQIKIQKNNLAVLLARMSSENFKKLSDKLTTNPIPDSIDMMNQSIERIDLLSSDCMNVKELNLSFNNIEDLVNMDQFTNLKYLDISNNHVLLKIL